MSKHPMSEDLRRRHQEYADIRDSVSIFGTIADELDRLQVENERLREALEDWLALANEAKLPKKQPSNTAFVDYRSLVAFKTDTLACLTKATASAGNGGSDEVH